MALIVETGLVVANSNSYVSRADYITYAASLGVTIANTEAADVQLIKAALFIGQHEENLKGFKVLRDQYMAFPRTGVVIDGWAWNYTEIPRNVILCQMQIALDINAGFDPWNPASNPNMIVKRDKVSVLETEYAVSDKTGQKLSRTSTADALLASLLDRSGLFSISLVRA